MKSKYSHTIKTEHFTFFYSEVNGAYTKQLSEQIEEVYTKLGEEFAISLSTEIYEFYVCDCVADYIFFTGKKTEEYQDWMVGWADNRQKRLCLLVTDNQDVNLAKIMVHEITHIVFDHLLDAPDDVECWISEGIAVYVAGQTDMQFVSEEEYPSIREISGKGECDAFYDNGGYDYAGIYVAYFMEKYGREAFLKAYKNQIDLSDYIKEGFEREAIKFFQKTA